MTDDIEEIVLTATAHVSWISAAAEFRTKGPRGPTGYDIAKVAGSHFGAYQHVVSTTFA